MQTQDIDLKTNGKAKGRRDKDGIEKEPDVRAIKDRTAECMKLYNRMQRAREQFNDACKKTADVGNIQTKALKHLIRVSATGQFIEAQRDVEQERFIFDAVGEIPGSVGATD